jgi:YD repeat-containing protein
LWNGQTHQWATFGYNDKIIQTGFSSKIVGIRDNAAINALIQVGFDDGTRYNFDYNAYGQVSIISHFAEDGHQLGYTSYTLTASADDCPRVTERRDAAENWTGQYGVPTEVATQYSTASDGSSGQMTMPDGMIYKELFATTNWQKGLTTGTEYWSGGVKKKWTATAYTQDDINLIYEKNPRVAESNIYDAEGNHKRTTVGYTTFALPNSTSCSLPSDVYEYSADAATLLRRTHTDYRYDSAYLTRRIIGLVDGVYVYDAAGNLASKVRYDYDWPQYPDLLQATPDTATQHDDANYGQSFCYGRANKVWEMRYDVTDPDNTAKGTDTIYEYYTTGSVIYARDPSGHAVNISYTDSFFDAAKNSLNTFAYPTTVTDADGFASTSQYNYDFGAVTRTQRPAPAGQSQGSIQTFEYDGAGRTMRVNNVNNGAYQRWVYHPAGYISAYATVQAGAQEAYSVTLFDGVGRVQATGGDNPNSTGGYRGQIIHYDVMGRVFQQSNPTEMAMNTPWTAAGDDAAVGWVWTQQAYDWKDRPTVTTNPDGTTKSTTYGGCGCAGGEVITIRDEMGRQQRATSDILGRNIKTEVLDWYPSQAVYSTTTNTYNARDQIINSRQYQGAEVSGIYQEAILTYDGHGRLATQKSPIQSNPSSFTYNADDTTNVVTDARGATQTLSYNNRHQVTGITYGAPSGVVATAPVSFGYDAAGNRISMTDGLGSTSYSYDQLSRLTSETRNFTNVGSFTLSYGYNLANELTSVTDPTGAAVGYAYDKTGRMTDVTGSGYANVTSYASNLRYRAWGGMKSMSYGNGLSLAASYTSRLQLASFEVAGRPAQYGTSTVMSSQYQYHADGSLKSAHDVLDERMDRAYHYDHVGRLQEAYTGSEARDYLNQTQSGMQTGPYRQTYQYSVWGELTARTNRFWNQPSDFAANYANGRNQNASWQYDNDGRVLHDETLHYIYDAAGRNRQVSDLNNTRVTTQEQDADGQVVRHTAGYQGLQPYEDSYYLRSSILGGRVITELTSQGQKIKGYVYAGGEVLARQENNQVTWQHTNPETGSQGESYSWGAYVGTIEADPMGVNVGVEDPFVDPDPGGFEPSPESPMIGGLGGGGCSGNPTCTRCFMDGFELDCASAFALLDTGAAEFAPPTTVWANGQWNFVRFNPVVGRYGHWESTGGGVSRDWDGNDSSSAGPVDQTFQANRRFVVDISAVTDSFFGHGRTQQTPQNPTPLTPQEVDTLHNDVQNLSSKCKEFLASVISELGRLPYSSWDPVKSYTTDVMKIFNDIAAAGGFHRKDLGGSAYALTNPNSLTTYIDEKYFTSLSREGGFASTQRGVLMAHELVHVAAGRGLAYSHDAMAQAAYNVSLAQGYQNVGAVSDPKNFSDTLAGRAAYNKAASNYFDSRVSQACF